jgi:hypothetical protein
MRGQNLPTLVNFHRPVSNLGKIIHHTSPNIAFSPNFVCARYQVNTASVETCIDRVFDIRERRMESIIQQAQGLGTTQMQQLQRWRNDDGDDFASCVERVMAVTDAEPLPSPGVSLEELDKMLDRFAARSSFSSSSLRERVKVAYTRPFQVQNALSGIFRRLHSSEAKWMVRMLLKTYSRSMRSM